MGWITRIGLFPTSEGKLLNFALKCQISWIHNEQNDAIERFATDFLNLNEARRRVLLMKANATSPLALACFLAAVRGYGTLFWRNKRFFRDQDEKRDHQHKEVLDSINEMILFLDAQEWNDTSEKKMAYQLILHYEKAMIEKLNKNFFSALNLVNEVIESQLNVKSKHDLETIPHQIFTFGKASTYAELQIYLIRSRLGKLEIFDGKKIGDIHSDMAEKFHHIKRNDGWRFGQLSAVRYFVYMDVLLLREFESEYTEMHDKTQRNGIDFSTMYDHISKHFADVDIVKLRSKSFGRTNKETLEIKRQHYSNLERVLRPLHSHRFLENDIKNKKSLVKDLRIVGDLSQNNPYNPRSLDYSNLTMFWNNRVDFTEWYQANAYRFERGSHTSQTPFFSLQVMSKSPASNINWANANADAIFLHSLRSEKIMRSETIRDLQSDSIEFEKFVSKHFENGKKTSQFYELFLQKSTGQLEGLDFELEASLPEPFMQTVLEKFEDSAGLQSSVKFMNHFSNSYPVYHFLSEYRTSLKNLKSIGIQKTLKINRLNAIGRGMSEIESILAESDKERRSLAERYNLHVLPRHGEQDYNQQQLLHYKLFFVIVRIQELMVRLQECRILHARTTINVRYTRKLGTLLRKYACLLLFETIYASRTLNLLSEEPDVHNIKTLLGQYKNEVNLKKDVKGAHWMFEKLLNEIEIVEMMLTNQSEPHKTLDEIYFMGLEILKTNHPSQLKKANNELPFDFPGSLAELNRNNIRQMRSGFASMLLDQNHEFCSVKLLTSRILSARLVQDFKDSFEK